MGGDRPFTAKLDEFFTAEGDLGEEASMDISGLIGMYAHGNEPSHHIVYLLPLCGPAVENGRESALHPAGILHDPARRHHRQRRLRPDVGMAYLLGARILSGEPVERRFVFGSPLFDRATLQLPGGRIFEIRAENDPAKNIYIQSVKLNNGQPYENSYITYDDIMAGGTLTFVMVPWPNEALGAKPENRPQTAI